MCIFMFDLERSISDLEGKNTKFRRMISLRMVSRIMYMHFQHSPVKTEAQVLENALNRQKNGNDLGDLDFDLVTLGSIGSVDLVHTYL